MGILTKHQIEEYLEKGELITNAHKKEDGSFDVQPASYDLRAGTLIWKEFDSQTKKYNTRSKQLDLKRELESQTEAIQPGQVMFVITCEEVKMPLELCGTVYAKNEFSRDGILAWTTGHVDPGIQCPIVIRLINFRATPYTIKLGKPIYTIVFHELADNKYLKQHDPISISMETTLGNTFRAADSILGNALYDISLINEFVKKDDFKLVEEQIKNFVIEDEFGKVAWRWIRKNVVKTILFVVSFLIGLATLISILPIIFNWLKKLNQ